MASSNRKKADKGKQNNNRRRPTYINPVFFRPGEVSDFVDQEVTDLNGNQDYTINTANNTKSDDDLAFHPPVLPPGIFDGYTTVPAAALPVVDNIVIESPMTLHIQPDGNHTVDVVILVPDLDGIIDYEIRVTRAAQ